MKNYLSKTIIFMLTFLFIGNSFSQEFQDELQMNDPQSSPFVITMPDNGAMYAIAPQGNRTAVILVRYNSAGTKIWERNIDLVTTSTETISGFKLHRNIQGGPRIIIGGNTAAGSNTVYFASLSETGNAANPISINFIKSIPINSAGGFNSFTILRSDEYLIPIARGSVAEIHFRKISFDGLTETLYQSAFSTGFGVGNVGSYVYDLVEDPTIANYVYFVGAIRNGVASDHNSLIGSLNVSAASINGIAAGNMFIQHCGNSYTDELNTVHRNSSFDRITIVNDNGRARLLVVGHINTIGAIASNNITIQKFDRLFTRSTALTNIQSRIFSFGGTIGTGHEGTRYDLRTLTTSGNNSITVLSGFSNFNPFIAEIDVVSNNFKNVHRILAANNIGNQQRAAYFDFIDQHKVWFGTEYSSTWADNNALVGILNLSNPSACHATLNPVLVQRCLNFVTLQYSAVNSLPAFSAITGNTSTLTITNQLRCGTRGDCCEGWINQESVNCNTFRFTFSSICVNPTTIIWSVDGAVVQTNGIFTYTFPNGTHTVTANFLGTQLDNTNKICCNSVTRSVTINTANTTTNMNLYTCPERGINCVWMAPCDPPYAPPAGTFNHYTLMGASSGQIMSLMWDSRFSTYNCISGCIAHCLPPGDYLIQYFSENGCAVSTVQIRITVNCALAPPEPPINNENNSKIDYSTTNSPESHAAITNTSQVKQLQVSPNPTALEFRILPIGRISESKIKYDEVQILNQSGSLVQIFKNVSETHLYSTSEIAAGIYSVLVRWNGKTETHKLIVTKP